MFGLPHPLAGDGAYAAGWNGFASAGGPDMNENIGYAPLCPRTSATSPPY